MNDFMTFYLILAIVGLGIVLLVLPTLIRGPQKTRK
jgi:hypothetical protein